MVSKTGWSAEAEEMDGLVSAVPGAPSETHCWVNERKWIPRAHWPVNLAKKPAPGH